MGTAEVVFLCDTKVIATLGYLGVNRRVQPVIHFALRKLESEITTMSTGNRS